MERKILVASTNPGKLAELKSMLGGGVKWVGLSDFEGIEKRTGRISRRTRGRRRWVMRGRRDSGR
jgi:inosine/xanthosine triphosphate pyrophosphatase family protein